MCLPIWPAKPPVQAINCMKQFIAFVIKEAKHILRDKRTMLILFGMPVVMMLLFGFAITTDVKNVRTVVVTSEMSPRTQRAIERLAQSEYFIITQTVNTPQEAERLIRSQKADMGIFYHHTDGKHPTGGRAAHPKSEGGYGSSVHTEPWHAIHA